MKKIVLALLVLTSCRAEFKDENAVRIVNFRTDVNRCESLGEIEGDGRVRQRVRKSLLEQTRELGGNVLFMDIIRARTRQHPVAEVETPEVIMLGEAFRCP